MPVWLAALIAAAITATYFMCIQPMRRGEQKGCCAGGQASAQASEADRLREELRVLREQDL